MPDYNEILQQIPMDQLASILGVDEATASAATQEALPALLGGLQANAADPTVRRLWRPHWAGTADSSTVALTWLRSTPRTGRRSSAISSARTPMR